LFANAALFFFGSVQHAGMALGRFHEPFIIPAAIVEALCGLCLLCGGAALFCDWRARWHVVLIANLVALGGVLLGIAALAVGAGPRTASNDLYHRMMLILIAAVILILFFGRSRLKQR
jgi:hypothetical protein